MTADVLAFLGGDPGRIALFEAVETAIHAVGMSEMAVAKTQISWGNPKKFAVFSFLTRSLPGHARGCAVLTLGLGRYVEDPRIAQVVEPYPGRWTHHMVLVHAVDLDGAVLGWLHEAYTFALEKRRRGGRI